MVRTMRVANMNYEIVLVQLLVASFVLRLASANVLSAICIAICVFASLIRECCVCERIFPYVGVYIFSCVGAAAGTT